MDVNNTAEESTAVAKLLIAKKFGIPGRKFEDAKTILHISKLFIDKPKETFTFLLGPNFNYLQTYEIRCTKDLQHEIVKFNVKRPQIAKSKLGIGIGISAAFIIVAVGIILAVIKWRQNLNLIKGSSMAKCHKVNQYFNN